MVALVKLGDHISTQKGYAFKSKWFTDEGNPIVKVSDFTEDSIDPKALVHISDDLADDYQKYRLELHDVVIQTVGSWPSNPASVVGKTVRVPTAVSGALLNQNAVRIAPDKTLHKGYLYYLLRTDDFKDYIIGTAQGAASQASITLDAIRGYKFQGLEFESQREIFEALYAYDNLIENNNRRIAILEEMAQSLYREWFVKFRFPGHEDCQFKDSSLGQIPEEWEVKRLEEVLETIIDYRGKTPKKLGGDWVDSGIKALSALNVKKGGLIRLDSCKQVEVNIFEKWMKVKLRKNDVLLTSEAPLGEVAILKGETEYCLSQRLFALRVNNDIVSPEYIFLALFSGHLIGQLTSRATGATVAGIRQALLKEIPIVVPPRDLISQFTLIAEPLLSLKSRLWQKNTNLLQQKNMLLPKLISGNIKVV